MKLDMHCHTKEGSPDGKLELLENIDILKQKGYQGMLITDHNSYKAYRYYKKLKKKPKDFVVSYIVFEFKNYGKKITQREIYTTEKYLFGTALRKVAIIISRQGNDDHALQAAKGSLRESGKLILCLSDADLLEMAAIKLQGSDEPAVFLSNMLDRLLVHLEK